MWIIYRLEVIMAHFFYFTGIYWLRKKRLEKSGARIVLVYHRVLDGDRKTGEMVGENSLEWQLRYLRKHFHPTDWKRIVFSPGPKREISVLVTFDDGYRDNFTRALPLLEKHRIPAVFFTVTKLVFGRQRINEDDKEYDDQIFPSADELHAAKDSPYITYGNHTSSHGIVSNLSVDEFEREINESQKEFLERLDITPEIFSFPRGRQKDVTKKALLVLERLNIKAAFTAVPGLVDSKTQPYLIPRIGMSHVNNKILFKVKLLGLLNPLVNMKNYFNL
jgi:peptidoglycan/xylan/chitin deacetylase (PgdA/CDA1 family)